MVRRDSCTLQMEMSRRDSACDDIAGARFVELQSAETDSSTSRGLEKPAIRPKWRSSQAWKPSM